jgi:hypothetical protein
MWSHYCREEGGLLDVGDGEECNWCGEQAPRRAPSPSNEAPVCEQEPSLQGANYSRSGGRCRGVDL